MKVKIWQIATAIAVIAIVALTSPAAGHAALRYPTASSCSHVYSAWKFKRAAKFDYRGTRAPTGAQRVELNHMRSCPRQLSDIQLDAELWHLQILYNWRRAHPPAPPVAQPASALASCIMFRESTDNAEAVNGSHEGLAQMSPTVWAEAGGTQYAATPLGASYSQQVEVLNWALAHGMANNWTPYDGCGD
jgi:hypothetical protein